MLKLLPDVFHFDEKFEEHRLEYEAIRREILGEDGDDSGSEDEDDDGEDDEDDAEAAASESGALFSVIFS
jgi:pre-mRNA-splicing factor CWC22